MELHQSQPLKLLIEYIKEDKEKWLEKYINLDIMAKVVKKISQLPIKLVKKLLPELNFVLVVFLKIICQLSNSAFKQCLELNFI
jgi:hypothetical protein